MTKEEKEWTNLKKICHTQNVPRWFDTEYCGSASETVQPCVVGGTILYILYAKGYNYVFDTVYQLHLYWNGQGGHYRFTCKTEEELENYLKNIE